MKKCLLLSTVLIFGITLNSAWAQSTDRDMIPGFIGSNSAASVDVPTPQTGTYYDGAKSTLLYDNGSFITHLGAGTLPDTSRLQATSLGMGTYGFGHQLSAFNRVADNITVTNIWTIDSIVFFGYQTGSTTTSTFNHYNLRVWNANPSLGGAVVWGDTTTNRLTNTYWTNVYRDLEGTPGTTRPIMRNVCTTTGLVLTAGTYWLDWQAGGTLASGPWAVPVTILGNTVTGDAWQRSTYVWSALTDIGAQGLPFEIWGTITTTGVNEINDVMSMNVYPNPSNDAVRIVSNEVIVEIELIDAMGRILYFDTPMTDQTSVSVANMVAGIYTIRVKSASGISAERLMVY